MYLLETPLVPVTTLDAALGRGPNGLMVLPAPTDPARMARLDEPSYTRVISGLQNMVGTVVLDCGTGLQEPAARAAVRCADTVLLVTDAEPSTASIVVDASRLLSQAQRPFLVVVNKLPRRRVQLDVEALIPHVPAALGVVALPWDADAATAIATGSFDWDDASAELRTAVSEMVAFLFSAWSAAGLAA